MRTLFRLVDLGVRPGDTPGERYRARVTNGAALLLLVVSLTLLFVGTTLQWDLVVLHVSRAAVAGSILGLNSRRHFRAGAILLIGLTSLSSIAYFLNAKLETVTPFTLLVVAMVAAYIITDKTQSLLVVAFLVAAMLITRHHQVSSGLAVAPTYFVSLTIVGLAILPLIWLQKTEQEAADRALRDAGRELQNILQTTVDGIATINPLGTVRSFNAAAEGLFGYRAEEVIGRNVKMLMPTPYRDEHDGYLESYQRTGQPKIIGLGQRIVEGRRKDGTVFSMELAVSRVGEGDRTVFTGIFRDVTGRLAHEEGLRRAARTDGLTGLFNRRALDEVLETEWRRASRGGDLSLLIVDVDYFKQYNDVYGHLAGDDVLRKIADTLRSILLRTADVPARYGGEEFCVVLPATDPDGARVVAERLRVAVEKLQIPHAGSPVGHLTLSIGCASDRDASASTPGKLLERADAALYEAKQGGRNRVFAAVDKGAFASTD